MNNKIIKLASQINDEPFEISDIISLYKKKLKRYSYFVLLTRKTPMM